MSESSSSPSSDFLKNAVFLVDSSSYIFRAYYAIRAPLKAPDGTPTHATHGFLQMLGALKKDYHAKDIVFVWDKKGKGKRHEIFPQYKANRGEPPEDLSVQIENTRITLQHLGFLQLDCEGYEADDVLATLVKKNPQKNFVIVTADKDLLQLVGQNCWCLDTLKGQWSNEKEALEKFGVEPSKIAEVQALCGDSVDNVPGAPGIGPKTATQLIQEFGSLDSVIQEAVKRKSDPSVIKTKKDSLSGKRIEAIADNVSQIELSLKMVSLFENLPCEINFSNSLMNEVKEDELRSWAQKMGFQKLLSSWVQSGVLSKSAEGSHTKLADGESGAGDFVFKPHTVASVEELKSILKLGFSAPLMALDTETFGLDRRSAGQAVGISFCFAPTESYYVPLRHTQGENLNPVEVIKCFQDFLDEAENFKKRFVFQNAKFDIHILESEGLKWPGHLQIDDTMVASFVLDPSGSHGMDALSQKHLSYAPLSYKELLGDRKNIAEVPIADTTFYAAEDAAVTLALWEKLSRDLEKKNLLAVYENLDRPLVLVLQKMERRGVLMDPQVLKGLSKDFHAQLKEIEKEVYAVLKADGVEIGEDFNLASTKQVAGILFEKLKLPVIKKGKTGPSTDVKVLEELSTMHPFPALLLEVRELSKLLSTYVDAFPELLDPNTSRMHTDYSQIIAATGRLASSNPNLQNIPIRTERGRKMRNAFVASPGFVFVGADYSQVELRVLAHMSQDAELIKAFHEGADIHKRTAALILKKPESEVNDDDRRMAKTINFGIVYGQTAFGLSKTLKIPQAQAKAFIEGYFKTYPGIRTYMDEAIDEAKREGLVRTLTGRARPLPEIHSKNAVLRQFAERMAINSPIQGTAADLMKAAMIAVDRRLSKEIPSAYLILQVHDELIVEAPENVAAEVLNLVKTEMENTALLKDFGIEKFRVPMKVDAGLGHSWGDL